MSTKPTNEMGASTGFGNLILALLLLYFGGWFIVWGDPAFVTQKAIRVASNGIAVRVNSGYYGIAFRDRWFDAPVISWAFGAIAAVSVYPWVSRK